jgi:VanZ family protein
LWLVVIAIESTSLLSSANTSRFLYPLLTYLFGHIDPAKFWHWHHLARKAGHVAGYGVLSLLLFRAWRATFPASDSRRWPLRWAGLAILGTVLTASLDEWHQTFLPSRTGTLRDVLLDSVAGLVVLGMVYGVTRIGKRVAR